jgi:DNA-binding CsgD family transcriptional regulator
MIGTASPRTRHAISAQTPPWRIDRHEDPKAIAKSGSRLLDLIPSALALFDRLGKVSYANGAFFDTVDSLRDRRSLLDELGTYARGARVEKETGPVRSTCVSINGRVFAVRATWLEDEEAVVGTGLLVSIQRIDIVAPSEEVLRDRYQVTPTEAKVAELLAEGLSNNRIAAALFISPHTARHHTERVLAKLGASSRAAVGARLRRIALAG